VTNISNFPLSNTHTEGGNQNKKKKEKKEEKKRGKKKHPEQYEIYPYNHAKLQHQSHRLGLPWCIN
jgi:hypothetical protein